MATVEFDSDNKLLCFPSGDWVDPRLIRAIRIVKQRIDRQTGAISASVAVSADGSWYTMDFDDGDQAKQFAIALAELCNRMARPRGSTRPLGRIAAPFLIERIKSTEGHDGNILDFPGEGDE